MVSDHLPERKSVHELAFEHYLRTGERLTNMTNTEWLARYEARFNPYHDEIGRFTSPPGASVSWWSHAPRLAARPPAGRSRPGQPQARDPARRAVIAEGGLRAAQQAMDTMRRAQIRAAPVRPPLTALLSHIAKGRPLSQILQPARSRRVSISALRRRKARP